MAKSQSLVATWRITAGFRRASASDWGPQLVSSTALDFLSPKSHVRLSGTSFLGEAIGK
jgi:hypothetical protein